MSDLVLTFDIASTWLHASGAGGGADFDLVMERDAGGLPLLRGRHVAGLLRLGLERAAAWGWFAPGPPDGAAIVDLLMGGRGDGRPGCLDIRSAVVTGGLRQQLQADPALAAQCFCRLATTAIEPLTGVARDQHLRGIEGALPLPLHATVAFAPADRLAWCGADAAARAEVAQAEARWRGWVATAWPAVDEVGARRTRGFGRLRPTACGGVAP